MRVKDFFGWTTKLRWLFVVLILAAATYAGRLLHTHMKAKIGPRTVEAVVRKPIPYTVTLREIVHGPNGTTTVGLEHTYAVRSDGSRMMRWRGKGLQRVIYLAAGFQVDTNDQTNTKSSIKKQYKPLASLRDPSSMCVDSLAGTPITSPPREAFVAEEIVAGYRTAKIADGIITSWYALDYGCAPVKERWEFSPTEVSEKELVSLVAGEPDPSLFDVPAHYREVPPSERLLGPNKEAPGCDEKSRKAFQEVDDEYKRLAAKPPR
ncbi:MAG TPA: hypothetical protein VN696_18850 [Pyrinomonadaceae bacterium]|nr:hypothetical protein [Pyrinomonadaceae bacterium]